MHTHDQSAITLLGLAAQKNYLNIVEYLLEKNADVNSVSKYGVHRDKRTALHCACEMYHLDIVKRLLLCKAINVNCQDEYQNTVLHDLAGEDSPWVTPGERHQPSFNANISLKNKDELKLTLLNWIIAHDQIHINAQNYRGNTPLHRACYSHRTDIVKALLCHPKINVNILNHGGNTPLHFLTMHGQINLVQAFLARSEIIVNTQNYEKWTALHYACDENFSDIILALLRRNDIQLNLQDCHGNTAFHYLACRSAKAEVVQAFLQYPGFNVNIRNHLGSTAYDCARQTTFYNEIAWTLWYVKQREKMSAYYNSFWALFTETAVESDSNPRELTMWKKNA